MTEVKDMTVLITGASSGIGEACSRRFSKEGARVILAARRLDRLRSLAATLPSDCLPLELDVSNRDKVTKTIAGLPPEWRDIDVLINNAGLSRGLDRFHEASLDDWEEMIDTNIKGLLYLSRIIAPLMVKRGRGHIINIGSIAGHEVYPRGNVYCATKHAVDAITKGMRLDLVETPVKVSTVDPGLVQTEFSMVRFRGDVDRAKSVYQGYRPLGGDDIADAVFWIASRPDHVQVAEIVIFPSAQASAAVTHKQFE
ncbi:MAG: SDR family oxidoreductase [Candidatus Zixiibacteriota bacterium]|nr:MAG: SDR family oxidoreductase [candidate division Zixibacteria bacterium]